MTITKNFEKRKAPDADFAYPNSDVTAWLIGLAVSNLPASAISVGVLLAAKFLNRRSGRCYPSVPKMMKALGKPESTVKDGIRALIKAGLLSTESRGPGKTNEYTFEIDKALVLALETGGRNTDGAGGRNLDGWGVENSTPEPEKGTCEFKPVAAVARGKAPAARDLSAKDLSFGPTGPQGSEVPREIARERRLA